MTYSVSQEDGRIDRIHSLAMRSEIGERLKASLGLTSIDTAPRLVSLLRRLRLSEMPLDRQ